MNKRCYIWISNLILILILLFYILSKFYRQWVASKPVVSQDESGYELPISKGGKSKRSIQASANNVDGASVSKPPLPRFVPLSIIKKKLKEESKRTKKNVTRLAFGYESKYESTSCPFLSLFFFFTK